MSERRYDPTHDEWVTIATHRQDRTYKPSAVAPEVAAARLREACAGVEVPG